MRSFDERAERAVGPSDKRRRPSPREMKAVRKILRSRNRRLHDHLVSIDVLLHLDGHGDPGDGPPKPGFSGSRTLAQRFDLVADEIRKIRDGIAQVDFDGSDKRDLRAALHEAAKSWDARARMVRATDDQALDQARAAAIRHDEAAAVKGRSVQAYFAEEER